MQSFATDFDIEMASRHSVENDAFESRFLKVEATQASLDAISSFALRFSEAVRENGNQAKQRLLVKALEEILAKSYKLKVFFAGVELIATNFDSLLQLVQTISSQVFFDSRLIGNFSVKKYKMFRKASRYLELDALAYVIQKLNPSGFPATEPSISAISKEKYTVVEEKGNVFKIKEFISYPAEEILLGVEAIS